MYRRIPFIVGCSALSFLAGCSSILGIGDRDVSISITTQRAWDPPPVFEVTIGRRRVELVAAPNRDRMEKQIQAPGSGNIPVTVRLILQGQTLATTQFVQEFSQHNTHWVAVDVGPRRPLGHCLGILVALPTGTGPDTAFVMYGRIPKDAIC